jgi:hypothetical protein
MLPTIDTKMWVKVQKFDGMRLLLATCTGSQHAKKSWERELDFFQEVEAEGKMFSDIIREFREQQGKMHVARSTLEGIIMPTDKFIKFLTRHFSGKDASFEDYQREVNREAEACNILFNKTEEFESEYPQYRLDDVLELMEHFHHIKPLPIKSGEQVFLCTCCDAYQKYCCVESTVLSLLYNLELEVPDIERLKQIKEREKLVRANPFNAKSIREKKRKEDKAKEKAAPKWNPHMPVYASCAPGSAADMALREVNSRQGLSSLRLRRNLRLPSTTPCRSPWTPSASSLPVARDLLRVVSILRRSTDRRRRYFASMC